MTPEAFIAKWSQTTTKERAAAQEHFVDLCRVLGEKSPHDADPTGEWYAFEKGVEKTGAGPMSGSGIPRVPTILDLSELEVADARPERLIDS